jgi:hypothetical protein
MIGTVNAHGRGVWNRASLTVTCEEKVKPLLHQTPFSQLSSLSRFPNSCIPRLAERGPHGLSGWPKLQPERVIRSSRHTKLQRDFPLLVVCSWLVSSPRFAQQDIHLSVLLGADFRVARKRFTESWVAFASASVICSSIGIVAITCNTFSVVRFRPLAKIDSSFG